jgi:hypothetical protein
MGPGRAASPNGSASRSPSEDGAAGADGMPPNRSTSPKPPPKDWGGGRLSLGGRSISAKRAGGGDAEASGAGPSAGARIPGVETPPPPRKPRPPPSAGGKLGLVGGIESAGAANPARLLRAGRLPPREGRSPPNDGRLPPEDGKSRSMGDGSSAALSGKSTSSKLGRLAAGLGRSMPPPRGDGSSMPAELVARGAVARAGSPTPPGGAEAAPTAGRFAWLRETEGRSIPPRCGAVAGNPVTPLATGPPTTGRSSSMPVEAPNGEGDGEASGAVARGEGRPGRSASGARPTAGRSRSSDGGTGAGPGGAAGTPRPGATDGRSMLPAGAREATAGRSADAPALGGLPGGAAGAAPGRGTGGRPGTAGRGGAAGACGCGDCGCGDCGDCGCGCVAAATAAAAAGATPSMVPFMADERAGATPSIVPFCRSGGATAGGGADSPTPSTPPKTGFGPVRRSSEGGSTLNEVPHFGQRIFSPLDGILRSSTW